MKERTPTRNRPGVWPFLYSVTPKGELVKNLCGEDQKPAPRRQRVKIRVRIEP